MEDVAKFSNEVDKMDHRTLSTFVHEEINKQLETMFTALEAFEEKGLTDSLQTGSKVALDKEKDYLLSQGRHVLHCKPSSIAGAGDGLFIKLPIAGSSIPPGGVVCLYPGLVHVKEYLKDSQYFATL